MNLNDWGKKVGEEARKNFAHWLETSFYDRFLAGDKVLDIGFSGYLDDVVPITPKAIGVGLDYPGYDGKVLPFPDNSQDAVFASHCLEHIPDYRTVIADWFRVLRVGGFLVVAVPHQYLYERRLDLPSRFNADHRRFYTGASLLREIEEAVDPGLYRVRWLQDNDRNFDYNIPPKDHACGCYEIQLVIEKITPPAYIDEINDNTLVAPATPGIWVDRPAPGAMPPVIAVASGEAPQSVILFKLDHLGDFIAASPVLADLRHAFPGAHLTLVCGSWNAQSAQETGIFDEIIPFSVFERNARLNELIDLDEALADLDGLLRGKSYDLAIDLRINSDTRVVLKHVNARCRAGFGTAAEFPYLDITLPMVSPSESGRSERSIINATVFQSGVGTHHGYAIEIPAATYSSGTTLVWGPYSALDAGDYLLNLLVEDDSRAIPEFGFDIACNGGNTLLARGECRQIAGDGISIRLDNRISDLEIRLWGRDVPTRDVSMRGCLITKWGVLEGPHQTELMAMLVALVRHRTIFAPTSGHVR